MAAFERIDWLLEFEANVRSGPEVPWICGTISKPATAVASPFLTLRHAETGQEATSISHEVIWQF